MLTRNCQQTGNQVCAGRHFPTGHPGNSLHFHQNYLKFWILFCDKRCFPEHLRFPKLCLSFWDPDRVVQACWTKKLSPQCAAAAALHELSH